MEALASQTRLDVPEPLEVGSPVQAHKIRTAVDGSSLGAVLLLYSKLVSSPAIREAFSLPWEEVFGFGVAVIVEAPVLDASLAKAVCSPSQAPSLIRWGFFWPEGCLSLSLGGEGGILVL